MDPSTILIALGPWALVGLALIVFAECGLLLGFFLPGDSLLFAAGMFAVSETGFVPVVRTFITVMAGVGRTELRQYLTSSLIGAVAWATTVPLLGAWLGRFTVVRTTST